MSPLRFRRLFARAVLLGGLSSGLASAAPALRWQSDLRGDLTATGNTLAQNCGAVVRAPADAGFGLDGGPVFDGGILGLLGGQVGLCGASADESSPDVFWRADAPLPGQAYADLSIEPGEARSTSVLELPDDAQVVYARLYWGAKIGASGVDGGEEADREVTFGRPGGNTFTLQADQSWVQSVGRHDRYFQATADVTNFVSDAGAGTFQVSGVSVADLRDRFDQTAFAAWSLLVAYRSGGSLERNLAIFDGFDVVQAGNPAEARLTGFRVPETGFDGKLVVLAYEGDEGSGGDSFFFDGIRAFPDGGEEVTDGGTLSDRLNPGANFFNSTRGVLGVAVGHDRDLPWLSGGRNTMSGMDLDIVDVSSRLRSGETSAAIRGTSSSDRYILGAFGTSISSVSPLLDVLKEATLAAPRPSGVFYPADVVTYRFTLTNRGNDGADQVVLTDVLPPELTFLPNSIRVVSGPGRTGLQTDQAGDDRGEYDPATRTVRIRIGAQATELRGGTVDVGLVSVVEFRAVVAASTVGKVPNLGSADYTGVRGSRLATTSSHPTGLTEGATLIDVVAVPPAAITLPAADGLVSQRTPTITGTGEVGLQVEVKIDGQVACTASVEPTGIWSCAGTTPLNDGPHAISATQVSGTARATATDRAFTVDGTPPDTTLTNPPSGTRTERELSLEFTGTDPAPATGAITFECSLDNAPFAACTSPFSARSLAYGEHTVRVRAKDAAGNLDPTPAAATWNVSGGAAGAASSGGTGGTAGASTGGSTGGGTLGGAATGTSGAAGGAAGGTTGPGKEVTGSGCGCSAAGGAPWGWLGLATLLAGARRRRLCTPQRIR